MFEAIQLDGEDSASIRARLAAERPDEGDALLERLVVVGALTGQLGEVPELAADDIGHPWYARVFAAARDVEALSGASSISIDSVVSRIEALDRERGTHFAETLSGHYLAALVARAKVLPTRMREAAAVVARNADARRRRVADGDVAMASASSVIGESTPSFDLEIESALAEIKVALSPSVGSSRQPLFAADAVALMNMKFEETIWLVDNLITRGGLTVVGGEPKTFKTWLALGIAIGVATGTAVFDAFPAMAGTAAYFFAEDMGPQVRNRLRSLLAGGGLQLQPGRLHVCPRGKFLDITRDDDLAWLIASCRRLGAIDLLVLDPLRDISSAAEDKSDEMAPVMRRLRLVAELVGCTVLVVHHKGKSGSDSAKRRQGQMLRGSGAIHGSIDSGIYLSDLKGDGTNLFGNTVDSEIKGARSAGRFQLTLKVEDDCQGEAVKASWTVTRESAAPPSKGDADRVFDFVRALANNGEHLSRTALRKRQQLRKQVPEKKITAALDGLLEGGRLELRGAEVWIPEPASRGSGS